MLTFGEKEPEKDYIVRPAVYGLMFDASREKMAVIQTGSGNYFLPGGGIENSETHKACLKREALEEMGLEITISRLIGSANQYFYAKNEDTHYLNEGHFYKIVMGKRVAEPSDEDHQLKWMKPSEAVDCLVHDHQRWAVKEYDFDRKER
ncbi:DNA mismatch repair protein MutT [Jeotgalibacillus alimentarius]|uniref:DNA mismatch repair protein MutT n=1 Tax=Jeotgalibacillus alimentarius TaxID=135826 RepID=A0A0C2RMY5_9BACL|nr:NUDIX domain-containing protein [Jeotgalibacillus alimentarius]KIL51610.1 DNA mismatch repair protein MutT [Jeotgalibacillus alimentarius]